MPRGTILWRAGGRDVDDMRSCTRSCRRLARATPPWAGAGIFQRTIGRIRCFIKSTAKLRVCIFEISGSAVKINRATGLPGASK